MLVLYSKSFSSIKYLELSFLFAIVCPYDVFRGWDWPCALERARPCLDSVNPDVCTDPDGRRLDPPGRQSYTKKTLAPSFLHPWHSLSLRQTGAKDSISPPVNTKSGTHARTRTGSAATSRAGGSGGWASSFHLHFLAASSQFQPLCALFRFVLAFLYQGFC